MIWLSLTLVIMDKTDNHKVLLNLCYPRICFNARTGVYKIYLTACGISRSKLFLHGGIYLKYAESWIHVQMGNG